MAAPALLIAIPLLAGVLFGSLRRVDPASFHVPLLLAWLSCAIAVWRWPARRAAGAGCLAAMAGLASAVAGFAVCGIVLGAQARIAAERPTLLAWFERNAHDRPVRLEGILREDAARGAASVGVTLDAQSVDGAAAEGGVRIAVAGALASGASATWRAGRTLALEATLREPLDYRDPGVASDRARLARQGIALLGSVKSAALVRVIARGPLLSEAAAGLRRWVREETAASVGRWSAGSAGVVTAILIGDRSGLSPDDERRLQEAGTYHVIAISGGNIALLTALLVMIGRLVGLAPRPTALASIAALAFYGFAAGLAPSVLRATVAGLIYLAARAADHRGTALNAIGVAAAVAAAAEPLSVLDPGFILSFGATFAIVVAIERLAPPPAIRHRDRPTGTTRRALAAAVAAARALGAATLCAEIALAPVGARLFGRVSLAGLILNFAAIPLMAVIQIAGLAAVALTPLSLTAGVAAGWVAHAGTVALLRSAALVDIAPWLVLDLAAPAAWVTAVWYGGWIGVLALRGRASRLACGAAVAAVSLFVLSGGPAARADAVEPPRPGWTRIAFLDVGQGDATFVVPAGARPFLVDAGGVPGGAFDVGRRVTLPAVLALGGRGLRALVLTHGDPDHIGGAPAVVRALAPSEIWTGIAVPGHEPLRRLRAAADRAGIPWIERRAGETIALGSVTLRVLHPPPPEWERQKVRNDDSVVLEARTGGVAVLLPGDITRAVEPDVLARFDPAPLVIVKAPHHGSAGSSSAPFVGALRPAAVIFSAGGRNPFGHPAPAVVDRYRAAGARVFSTAEDGAIVIDTDGRQALAWCPASGRRETLGSASTQGRADRQERKEP